MPTRDPLTTRSSRRVTNASRSASRSASRIRTCKAPDALSVTEIRRARGTPPRALPLVIPLEDADADEFFRVCADFGHERTHLDQQRITVPIERRVVEQHA